MKVLVVGSGGREHALVWKLSQSRLVSKIFTAPGNPGTAIHGENVPIKADDIHGLRDFALKEGVDLTVVGPELPLTLGITDLFEKAGLMVFGPSKKASVIEGSKVFCKELMERYGIPTAGFRVFEEPDEAYTYIRTVGGAMVVKADGLAGGKGAIVCRSEDEAMGAVRLIMEEKAFGEAGRRVVIEEFLDGEEASFIAFTDGRTVVPLASSQDHKPVYDGDRGPNTGGMGAYSPAPVVTDTLRDEILHRIMIPAVRAMEGEGRPYRGILYAGIMITKDGPKVLEFNCRFGDPETQPLVVRLRDDLLDVMVRTVEGRLQGTELEWDERASVCVVMASKGYPGDYEKGKVIEGLERADTLPDVVVFHAGTSLRDGKVVTSGGRVLGVTGLGGTIEEAIENTYRAVGMIHWDGAYYRRDIGMKAIRKSAGGN